MIKKINSIKYSKHPFSEEIDKAIVLSGKFFNSLLFTVICVGFIAAIVAAVGLAEWADGFGDGVADVPVNFFGYFIELESDTPGGSPLIVFLYIMTVTTLISSVILCIKAITVAILRSKANMLDSLYHSEQLTELLILHTCNLQDESGSPQTKPSANESTKSYTGTKECLY